MMNQRRVTMILKWLGLLVVANLHCGTMAASLDLNTPIDESRYEASQQGWLIVNATVFNAPCNLQIKANLTLTECGAGNVFHQTDVLYETAKTPVIVQFYDAQKEQIISHDTLSLSNGDNPIKLPLLVEKQHSLRLEVIYE
ncbi:MULTISPECIES: hypothetical protein [Providencia]|uniref:hypothetical protein n=1 Tax=Providencia TaxID=586 RepID=UPI000839208C|nr:MULTISPECIES: hypothetical protein [Providencia]MBP6123980.1 fimbrial protein [Providencia sp.]MDD9339329.1 fimbrial protein [Providencia heimbachae]NIH21203.1 fimbrial protein [Providencia heimbachae]